MILDLELGYLTVPHRHRLGCQRANAARGEHHFFVKRQCIDDRTFSDPGHAEKANFQRAIAFLGRAKQIRKIRI